MRLLILGGPYSGKTTAHNAGKGVDVEQTPEYLEFMEKSDDKADGWKEYSNQLRKAIDSDQPVVFGHFAKDAYEYGIRKRLVRIVVLPPDELERRANDADDVSRSNAALHQLAGLADWLATKQNRVKLYTSIDAAIKGGK